MGNAVSEIGDHHLRPPTEIGLGFPKAVPVYEVAEVIDLGLGS